MIVDLMLILYCDKLLSTVTTGLTYIGATYILWLAWYILRNTPNASGENEEEKKPTFRTGFFLNLTNVKIILYGLTVFQIYVIPYYKQIPILMLWAVMISAIGTSSTIVWALFGKMLSNCYIKHYKICNLVMALLLVWCVIKIFFLIHKSMKKGLQIF